MINKSFIVNFTMRLSENSLKTDGISIEAQFCEHQTKKYRKKLLSQSLYKSSFLFGILKLQKSWSNTSQTIVYKLRISSFW